MDILFRELRKLSWENRYKRYATQIGYMYVPRIKRDPKVSVVVISYRDHPNTEACLFQIKRYPDTEIIFVNNGGGAGIGRGHPLVDTYIETVRNEGAYLCRNIGAVMSNSFRLAFVDDDGIPCDNMIRELYNAHEKYDIVSCMGCCYPLTNNLWNYDARHYYFGPRPFPYFTNLEGNCMIDSSTFFRSGGWDDNLNFGGGGYDMTRRMLKVEPDKRKYAYIPSAILYHDYTSNTKAMISKRRKQLASVSRNLDLDPGYYYDRDVWVQMVGREDLLIERH